MPMLLLSVDRRKGFRATLEGGGHWGKGQCVWCHQAQASVNDRTHGVALNAFLGPLASCPPCSWPCSQLRYLQDNLTVAWHLNETFLGQDSSYKKVREQRRLCAGECD